MSIHLAHFRCDVTPPLGFPLCAGWYPEAHTIGNKLEANGVIVVTDGQPTVILCALDWAGISNHEHLRWREALARAVGTDADHVTVHCTHCHDSPWPDQEMQELLDQHGFPDTVMKGTWASEIQATVATAAKEALKNLQPCTHVATGQEPVVAFASNRRVMADGKVKGVRYTYCRDLETRDAPEGLIDPFLKTISFWNGDHKLAAMHYYANHPTAYDRTGIVTPECVGLARTRISDEEKVPHLYFTGCAGNVTAGRYNNGDDESRERFAHEIYRAMKASEANAQKQPLKSLHWHREKIHLPVRPDTQGSEAADAIDYSAMQHQLSDGQDSSEMIRAALVFTYRNRAEKLPITVTALQLNQDIRILHLPGEPFIEYQHFAYTQNPESFACVVGYGDMGPSYICLKKSFAEGGYEPTDSFCSAASEAILKSAITKVMTD